MNNRNLVLPGNPRYQPNSLKEIFGYDNLYLPMGLVEIANMSVLGEIGIIPQEEIDLLTPSLVEAILSIPTTEVDAYERAVTQHDIRAFVALIQQRLPESLQRWVHIVLTSYDPIDTGRVWQYTRAHQQVVRLRVSEVTQLFIELVEKFADQVQIGRTHGQHALPITVGFWLATILNRIVYNLQKMDQHASELVGKISGAVGAYNAQVGLGITARCGEKTFEERVLEKLGLKPALISTQILPPEPLAYYLYSAIMLSASLGQLGRDGRNLMRSEIAEIVEGREEGQVGSSTMAGKRNPINFESLEGDWLKNIAEFLKVLLNLISEHQRDLVGSRLQRDFPTIIVNLVTQLDTLLRKDKWGIPFLGRLTIDASACERNLALSANLVMGEPIYIALQMAGYRGDAHKLVNDTAAGISRTESIPLISAVEIISREDKDVAEALSRIPKKIIELLHDPSQYTGLAKEKALQVASLASNYLSNPRG